MERRLIAAVLRILVLSCPWCPWDAIYSVILSYDLPHDPSTPECGLPLVGSAALRISPPFPVFQVSPPFPPTRSVLCRMRGDPPRLNKERLSLL